ncbi:hypothetical protein [Qipengyuania sp. NPDC077563]|uniref:hypothetical protein n=1 Tax=Qipengyuania sp. NPDC077563 TaxID=3364497 RepID=UPI00384A7E09
MQIDEISNDINPDQLSLALLVVQLSKHGSFDDEVGVFDPLSALYKCLSRFQIVFRGSKSTVRATALSKARFSSSLKSCRRRPFKNKSVSMAILSQRTKLRQFAFWDRYVIVQPLIWLVRKLQLLMLVFVDSSKGHDLSGRPKNYRCAVFVALETTDPVVKP